MILNNIVNKMSERISTISMKIPFGLNKVLMDVAKKEDRSKSAVVRIALQNYFEYLENQEDLKIAKKVYKEYVENGKQSIGLEEFSKKYDLDN